VIEAVLDANVIVSGFPAHGGAPGEIIERWLAGEFHVIVSEHILASSERAWNSPWFRLRYPRQQADEALATLRARARIVVPAAGIHGFAPDWEDDLVLATAVAGSASYLVTGDRRFRMISSHDAIMIRTPREFVHILDQTMDSNEPLIP
jgi:uncharacterized protein